MSDRTNRTIVVVLALILLVGGVLGACLSGGVFGSRLGATPILNTTIVRWWDEGGWRSYAVVGAIGAVLAALGVVLAIKELRLNDGRSRPTTFLLEAPDQRGLTGVRAGALRHAAEMDLARRPGVRTAVVGFVGRPPALQLRTLLEAHDDADVAGLGDQLEASIECLEAMTGWRPDPVQVTVRFSDAAAPRQLK